MSGLHDKRPDGEGSSLLNRHSFPTKLLESSPADSLKHVTTNEAALVVVGGPHKGEELKLTKELSYIGREVWCDLYLERDDCISALHCEAKLENGFVRIRDRESKNGLFYEGSQVYDFRLCPGGSFHLGETEIELRVFARPNTITIHYSDRSNLCFGSSPAMRDIFALIEKLAPLDHMSLLLQGETGTGKTTLARSIHEQSRRKNGPFVTINCATLPENLIESELFGHAKGAFTGATGKPGLIEQANGGTLFLDEIGELPLKLQPKLLRVVEEMTFRRVGGTKERKADFRLLLATLRPLEDDVKDGRFREDLFFRVAKYILRIPPLRERLEDIPLLVRQILSEFEERPILIDERALHLLQHQLWPGNIRELRTIIEQALVFLNGDTITSRELGKTSLRHLESESARLPTISGETIELPVVLDGTLVPLKQLIEEVEKTVLTYALKQTDGNVPLAAKRLCISKAWMYNRINKHTLKKSR